MIRFRAVRDEDKPEIEKAMGADPFHRDQIAAAYYEPVKGTENFVVEDDAGAVFYVHVENVMRVYIQFRKDVSGKRTARAIGEGLPKLAGAARARGYREMIYDSVHGPLVKFLSRFGFKPTEADYRRIL